MKRLAVPLAVAIAVLSGCAPATSEAWGNCVETVASTYRLQHDIADDSPRFAESLESARKECDEERANDPEQFAELWSD